MIEIVYETPEHVKWSPHMRERAPFFLLFSSFGVGYYVPATPEVRKLFGIDAKGNWIKKLPGLRQWRNRQFAGADALRDIVEALYAQARDVELAEIETNVTGALMNRLEQALTPTIRRTIKQATPPLLTDARD